MGPTSDFPLPFPLHLRSLRRAAQDLNLDQLFKPIESVSPTRGAALNHGSPYPQLEGPQQGMGVCIPNSRGHTKECQFASLTHAENLRVRIPNSRGHNKVWESVSPTRGGTLKRGSPYPQLEGPHQGVGVCIPNSRGHTKECNLVSRTHAEKLGVQIPTSRGNVEAWESVSPTLGATPRREGVYPQLKGPHQGVGVGIPNPRGKLGSTNPQLKGPHQGLGVRIRELRGNTKVRESVYPTRGATLKCGSPYPQNEGPRQSLGVRSPNSRGHSKAWESVFPPRGATPKSGSPHPQLEGPHQGMGVRIPNSRGHTPGVGMGISNPRPNLGVRILPIATICFCFIYSDPSYMDPQGA